MEDGARVIALVDRVVDLKACEVRAPGGAAALTATEVALLRYLADRPGQAVGRDELLRAVWEYKPGLQTRAVDYAVWRLRQKVEADPSSPRSLVSVHGVGYRLDVAPPEDDGDVIGRAADLRRVCEALDAGASWLTLIGPGGVGKSTLLRVLATSRGMTMVELASASTRAGVLRALAAGLGLAVEGTLDGVADAIGEALPSAGPVALDNLEQVADQVGDDLARWAAAGAVLVVASRRPIGHPREERVLLAPLDPEAARRLLEVRVRAARGDDAAIEHEVAERLLARLDGIPLAIELAAARARLLPLDDLAERLEASSAVLRAPAGDAGGRHGSLQRVLVDSWALLDRPAQRALARCAVFVGPFEVAAAEAVTAPVASDPLAALEVLELQGLVRRRADGRLALLEVVRGFAADRLDAGDERADAEARHRAWWLERLARDEGAIRGVEDVLAAIRRALPTHTPDAVRLLLEGRPLLDRSLAVETWLELLDLALGRRDVLGPAARVGLLSYRGRMRRRAGEQAAARADLDAAVAEARDHGDRALLGEVLHGRGSVLAVAGERDAALADMREAGEAWRAAGDPVGEAMALGGEGNVLLALGRPREAEARLREALAVGVDLPYGAEVLLRNALGNACMHDGRADEAMEHYEAALRALGGRDDPGRRGVVLGNLALVRLGRGDLAGAEDALRSVVDAHRRTGRFRSRGVAEGNLGRVRWLRGADTDAVRHLEAAAAMLHRAGDQQRAAFYRMLSCMVHAMRGRLEAATFAWEHAVRHVAIDALPPGPHALAAAALQAARGERDDAIAALHAARASLDPVLHPDLDALLARL